MRRTRQRDGGSTPGEHVTPESRFPHGMRNTATTYASFASTDVAAY
jgi:hypothetical protein